MKYDIFIGANNFDFRKDKTWTIYLPDELSTTAYLTETIWHLNMRWIYIRAVTMAVYIVMPEATIMRRQIILPK